jgi:hypothetical protein
MYVMCENLFDNYKRVFNFLNITKHKVDHINIVVHSLKFGLHILHIGVIRSLFIKDMSIKAD